MAAPHTSPFGPDNDGFYKITWCKCDECYVMTTKADEKCCIPEDKPSTCITKDDTFIKFVNEELSIPKLKDYDPQLKVAVWAYAYKEGENADFRRKAYDKLATVYARTIIPRKYSQDWGNLPSCVKWHIRKLFSEADGKYTGYFPKSADLLELTVKSNEYFKTHVELITKVVKVVDIKLDLGPLSLMVPTEIKDELIRMGEVSIFAAFEAFAHDSLRLCFDVGFSKKIVATDKEFITWLENQAPNEKKTTHQRLHFYKQIYERFGLNNFATSSDPAEQQEWITAAPGKILERLLEIPDDKRTITVMQTIIKSIKKSQKYVDIPTALEFAKAIQRAIAESAGNSGLREPDVQILMAEFAKKEEWSVVLPSRMITIKVQSFETLQSLSRLFYGLRCIHAHGDAERTTIGKKGVLTKLVLDKSTIKLTSTDQSSGDVEKVEDYFKKMLTYAKSEGKAVSHDLSTYQTMCNFYEFFAKLLGKVCGCVVYYNVRQFNITSTNGKGTAFGLTIPEMDDAINKIQPQTP